MTELLHEYWEDDGGAQFGPVTQGFDRNLTILMKNPRLVFALRASSWRQALQLHNDRLGYGDVYWDDRGPDGHYTEEELAEQGAYLAVRPPR